MIFSGALCDGETCAPRYVQGAEGGSIRVACSIQFVEIGRKFFCKGECEGEDVLVQTIGFQAQNGRYSLRYAAKSLLYVSITQLMKSDAGRYRCGVRRAPLPDSYKEFEVIVTDGEFLLKVVEMFVRVCGGLKKDFNVLLTADVLKIQIHLVCFYLCTINCQILLIPLFLIFPVISCYLSVFYHILVQKPPCFLACSCFHLLLLLFAT